MTDVGQYGQTSLVGGWKKLMVEEARSVDPDTLVDPFVRSSYPNAVSSMQGRTGSH